MSEQNVLDVRDLRVSFETRNGTVHAVNGVDFAVARGEVLGIVGESGCGKSATLRAVAGLTRAPGRIDGGQVLFGDRDLMAARARELTRIRGRDIGFISQSPFGALNPILSIEDQFRNIIRAHRRASSSQCRRIALAALADVGIAGPERVLGGYAHQLSGGMAQRVVIAMAMIHDPLLLLADEPTTALDVTVQRQILDLVTDLVREGDRSMILVTHDLSVVAQYCNRVLVMYAGKPVEEGTVREVFRTPRHPYTAALLAAVPRAGREITGLRGGLPDLIHYPRGCPYADRCPRATDVCVEVPPAFEPGDGLRAAACHHPLEEVPSHVAS